MTTQTTQRDNILIGQVQGCPVLASYCEDGELGIAEMEWQGLKVSTDGNHFINLDQGPYEMGFGGDIPIQHWRIVRDLVQCDVIEELTALALAHQSIGAIDGYVPEDEIADDMPIAPQPPALPSTADLKSQIIGLAWQLVRMQKEPSE